MEKKCANCKYYNLGECMSKDFRESINPKKSKDDFIYLTESGLLAEGIRENNKNIYELANVVINKLYELEYIKKTKKKINTYKDIDNYEEFLQNYIEKVDETISNFVIPQLKDVDMDYNVNKDFCCKFWE